MALTRKSLINFPSLSNITGKFNLYFLIALSTSFLSPTSSVLIPMTRAPFSLYFSWKATSEVKKGDLLVFDSRLIHGRSPNLTKEKNRDITFEFYSKSHEKRIYSYSIPSIHLSKKVQEKIKVFSTPLKISEPNPIDPVAEKMFSPLYDSRNGIYAMRFSFSNFVYFTKIYLNWICIGLKKFLKRKLKGL